jgi:hypothetical protein
LRRHRQARTTIGIAYRWLIPCQEKGRSRWMLDLGQKKKICKSWTWDHSSSYRKSALSSVNCSISKYILFSLYVYAKSQFVTPARVHRNDSSEDPRSSPKFTWRYKTAARKLHIQNLPSQPNFQYSLCICRVLCLPTPKLSSRCKYKKRRRQYPAEHTSP